MLYVDTILSLIKNLLKNKDKFKLRNIRCLLSWLRLSRSVKILMLCHSSWTINLETLWVMLNIHKLEELENFSIWNQKRILIILSCTAASKLTLLSYKKESSFELTVLKKSSVTKQFFNLLINSMKKTNKKIEMINET